MVGFHNLNTATIIILDSNLFLFDSCNCFDVQLTRVIVANRSNHEVFFSQLLI